MDGRLRVISWDERRLVASHDWLWRQGTPTQTPAGISGVAAVAFPVWLASQTTPLTWHLKRLPALWSTITCYQWTTKEGGKHDTNLMVGGVLDPCCQRCSSLSLPPSVFLFLGNAAKREGEGRERAREMRERSKRCKAAEERREATEKEGWRLPNQFDQCIERNL